MQLPSHAHRAFVALVGAVARCYVTKRKECMTFKEKKGKRRFEHVVSPPKLTRVKGRIGDMERIATGLCDDSVLLLVAMVL